MNDSLTVTLKGELVSFLINEETSWEFVVASMKLVPADRMVCRPCKTGVFPLSVTMFTWITYLDDLVSLFCGLTAAKY
jgi:hypothetical protein